MPAPAPERVLAVVGCAADGLERLRTELVGPALDAGWRVAVTLTPAAAGWLDGTAEVERIERATGLPVRSRPRLPGEPRPHPDADRLVAVPATANTVAKLALGISDNQALTVLCEGLGRGAPVTVAPQVRAAHRNHPAWAGHVARLQAAGVTIVYGTDEGTVDWAAVLGGIGRPDLG